MVIIKKLDKDTESVDFKNSKLVKSIAEANTKKLRGFDKNIKKLIQIPNLVSNLKLPIIKLLQNVV